MSELTRENEDRLRGAIAEYGLQSVEAMIVEHAVECAALSTTELDDYATPGVSRYGGQPDLPRDMQWPQSDMGEWGLDFLLQVNLTDVPAFAGKQLPDRGMLYVFFEDGELTLRYSPVESADDLIPGGAEPVREDELQPCRIAIEASVDLPEWTSEANNAIMSALEEAHDDPSGAVASYDALARQMRGKTERWAGKLQGQPCWIGYTPDWTDWGGELDQAPNPANGWMLLLQLDSNSDTNAVFGDAGYLLAFIKQNALAEQNFDTIYSQLESS